MSDVETPMVAPKPMSARRTASPASLEGEQHLHSITRLLREKDEQVEAMQEDLENLAAQYERDKALWNEKEKETSQLRIDNKFLVEENRTLKAMLETERDDYITIKEEKMQLESLMVEAQNQQKEERQAFEDKTAQLQDELDCKVQELQLALDTGNKWQTTMQAALKERDEKLEEKQERIMECQACLEENEACIRSLRVDLQELRRKFELVQQESIKAILALQSKNEGLRRQARSFEAESKKQIEDAEEKLRHARERNKELHAELEEFEIVAEKMLALERRVSARDGAANKALHEARTKLKISEDNLALLQEQYTESQKKIADLVERLEDAEEELAALKGKVPSAVALGKLASALASEAREADASYEMIALAGATERVALDMEEGLLDLEPSGSICTPGDLRLVQQGIARVGNRTALPPASAPRPSQSHRHPLHEQDGNSTSLEQQYAEAKLHLVQFSSQSTPAAGPGGTGESPWVHP